MITRTTPYKFKCDKTDPFYKYILENNFKQFWEKFIKQNGSDLSFSESFMDLMNTILNSEPIQRATLAEIKSHEWYLGDVLTMDQLREEMTKRTVIKEALRIKIQENIQLMKHKKASQDIVFHGVLHFRSFNLNVFFVFIVKVFVLL